MTVNGIDICIPEKGIVKKGNPFVSHKYTGSLYSDMSLALTSWAEGNWYGSRVLDSLTTIWVLRTFGWEQKTPTP